MLSYWMPGSEPAWLMALFAAGFTLLAVVTVGAALSRRTQEPEVATAATLYVVGLGSLAASELLSVGDAAWGWSLAAAFGVTDAAGRDVAGIVTAVTVLCILVAAVIELLEAQSARAHSRRHT